MSTALPRDADLDALVNSWLDHRSAAEKHANEAKRLQAEILVKVGPGRRYELDNGEGVTVTAPVERVDEDRAKTVLTADQYEACLVRSFSVAQARKVLCGALVDLCKVAGSPTVRAL